MSEEKKTFKERYEKAKENTGKWLKANWPKVAAGMIGVGTAVVGAVLVKKYSDETKAIELTPIDTEIPLPDPAVSDDAEVRELDSAMKFAERKNEFLEKGGDKIIEALHQKQDEIRQLCVDNDIVVNSNFSAGFEDQTFEDTYHYNDIWKDGEMVFVEMD